MQHHVPNQRRLYGWQLLQWKRLYDEEGEWTALHKRHREYLLLGNLWWRRWHQCLLLRRLRAVRGLLQVRCILRLDSYRAVLRNKCSVQFQPRLCCVRGVRSLHLKLERVP